MSVIALVVLLVGLGVIGWVVNAKLPISPTFKLIVNIVLIAVALILVMAAFGVWNEIKSIKVPQI